MTTVFTRETTAEGASNQNAPLTNAQLDANFINLNNDKAPLDGTGTNGTWPINVTGSAAKLQTARTINGVAFDGTANITVTDDTKEPTIAAGTTAQYYRGDKTWQTLNSSSVGLGNVNNTSDADKPVSTATQNALDSKLPLTGGTVAGELISSAVNTFRVTQGNYGVFWRNDGTNTYLMVTASGDPYGTYTAARPLSMINATGVASINGNAATASAVAWTGVTGKPAVIAAGADAAAARATIDALADAPSDGKTYGRKDAAWAEAAPLASPALTGTPTAPTAAVGTNTTQLATTAHVFAERAATATLTNKTLASPVSTGGIYDNGSVHSNIVAVAALNIDCSLGNYFTKTINGTSTFTFSNAPASRAYAFTLELTHTSGAVTWPASVVWPGNTAPALTAGKTHLFVFVTYDGGTRWRGVVNADYPN